MVARGEEGGEVKCVELSGRPRLPAGEGISHGHERYSVGNTVMLS